MYLHEMPAYEATVDIQRWPDWEILDWCEENFESGSYWYCGRNNKKLTIGFGDGHNRTLFLVRWA